MSNAINPEQGIRMILYRILRKHRSLSSLRLMLSREPERREKSLQYILIVNAV